MCGGGWVRKKRALAVALAALAVAGAAPAVAGAVPVYVTDFGSSSVSVFSTSAGGALVAQCTSVCPTTTAAPEGVAIDPTGSHAYVSIGGADTVLSFSIGPSGALSAECMVGSTCPGSASGPAGIAVDPTGRYVYAANNGLHTVSVFSISSDGALTAQCNPASACPATGNNPAGVAVDPSGRYVYVTNPPAGTVSEFSIGTGGALTALCSPASTCPAAGTDPDASAVDPRGPYLYVVHDYFGGGVSVFSIGADGKLTPVPCNPIASCDTGSDPDGIAVDPIGGYVYVADGGPNTVSVFKIGAGGALTPVPCSTAASCETGSNPYGVAVDPTGHYVYVTNDTSPGSVSEFSIGPDGALTPACTVGSTCPTTGNEPYHFSIAFGPDRGPSASFAASATGAGGALSFNASGSTSPDYPIASYAWSFGDGQATTTSSASTQHAYAHPGSYTVELVVTDQAHCSVSEIYTGQTASCNGSSKALSVHTVTVLATRLSGLGVSPRTFKLSGRKVKRTCVAQSASNRKDKACKRRVEVSIKYTLSSASAVALTINRQESGRRVKGKCVERTEHNAKAKRCTRMVTLHGSITLTGKVGANTYTFAGRIDGRKLGAGTYELTLTPAGGTSSAVTLRIV